MDGVVRPITIESIHGFQSYIKTTYNIPLILDKAVDPTKKPFNRFVSTLG